MTQTPEWQALAAIARRLKIKFGDTASVEELSKAIATHDRAARPDANLRKTWNDRIRNAAHQA